MHGQDRRLQRAQRADRLRDGVGNVVELQVEEDRQPQRRHLAHAVLAILHEEFEAELEAADMGLDLCGNGFGAVGIGRVDRDEDGAGHGVGQALASVASRASAW